MPTAAISSAGPQSPKPTPSNEDRLQQQGRPVSRITTRTTPTDCTMAMAPASTYMPGLESDSSAKPPAKMPIVDVTSVSNDPELFNSLQRWRYPDPMTVQSHKHEPIDGRSTATQDAGCHQRSKTAASVPLPARSSREYPPPHAPRATPSGRSPHSSGLAAY